MDLKRKTRFYVQTFGCQMNVNDSERLTGLLQSRGLEPAGNAASADFVFLNTCAVREKAEAKLRHSLARLRRLKRSKPTLRIGVGGCVSQLHGSKLLEREQGVDLLVGTHNLHRVPELLERVTEQPGPAIDLDRRADPFAVPPAVVAHGNPVRAYVTVMEGCNQVCSFCVVPRTRGPEVSRPFEEVVSEVELLVARGFPEVMLLGQTVNAYRHNGVDFAGLLERLDGVAGLRRLRFTTSHPTHVDKRMIAALRNLPTVCPYLHLPFQSGADRILAAMRRGYTRQAYLDRIAELREGVAGLVLSTDVIAGYPGETEAEFAATLDVLERVRFAGVFAFTYSPRPGTAAFRAADDVPEETKLARLHLLNDRQQAWQRESHERRVGCTEEVLVETVDGGGRVSGRTPEFRIVHFDGAEELLGQTVDVVITAAGPNALQGRLSQHVH